jgi:conjugative relaxase-like TrwC/TraI family protein
MLTVSKALSAKQAKSYYRNDYSNAVDAARSAENSVSPGGIDFETENEARLTLDSSLPQPNSFETGRANGEWHGKLAEEMGLRGAVETEQFERLCDGLHPETEKELVRHAPIRKYADRHGKEITTMAHRAGWDATFSAPKSVSLAAIVGGDERIKDAHRQSVHRALDEVEKCVEARLGGNNPSERTGKMISALFEHDAARPDKALKYAAPQLHTHSVIFNLTETEKGLTKPIQPLEIYRTQKYATAVYRIELAEKLQRLGYEIEIDRKTKAPEIKGFSSEYLKENSPRSQELQKETEAVKSRFESAGVSVKNDAGIRQVAAWQSRESKAFDPEEMKSRSLELEVKYDFEAQRICQRALQNNSIGYDAAQNGQRAKDVIDFAKDKAIEQSLNPQNKLLNERQFLTEALETGIGQTNFSAVREEFTARTAAGEFANLIKGENERLQQWQIEAEPSREIKQSQEIPSEINKPLKENSLPVGNRNFTSENNRNAIEQEKSTELKFDEEIQPMKSEALEKEHLSMDDLEKAVRRELVAQKEIAQSAEILLAL